VEAKALDLLGILSISYLFCTFCCFGVDENIAATFLLQGGERRKTSFLAPYLPSLF